ncbi:MAG: hypothetical protein AAGI25_10110 [Bacteroidota bacterium]
MPDGNYACSIIQMMELKYADAISHEAIRGLLKKRMTLLESERMGDPTIE